MSTVEGQYVLNSFYKLKADKKRILIYPRELDAPAEEGVSYFQGFVHPILAILLGLFDGKKRLNKVVEEFAYLTGLKEDFITRLVSSLVENQTEIKIDFNGRSFYFPKNTLIGAENLKDTTRYQPGDFLIHNSQLDFDSRRLYDPLDAQLMLNNRCASRCIYCYVDKRKPFSCRIPFTRIVELIREAKEIGMRSFHPAGGELFSYPYWRELLKALLENNIYPYITTKYPLKEERIKELKDIGIKRIYFSLDTVNRSEMCRLLRVNENYYHRVLKTLKYLNDNNFDIYIQSQVTSINQDSMGDLLNYLSTFENIKVIKVRATTFSLYSQGNKNDYRWLRPDLEKLDRVKEMVLRWGEKKRGKVHFFFHDFPGRKKYINPSTREKQVLFENRPQCSGNFDSFFILPDGQVTICEGMYWNPHFIIGNVMRQSIREVWNSEKALSLYHFSRDSVREQSGCKTCKDFDRCHQGAGVCWKQVVYAYGEENWDYPDPRCPRAPRPLHELWIE